MEISHTLKDNQLTVNIKGRLDSLTSGDLMDFLNANFTQDVQNLVLDFAEVDFISSKGLRVLVSVYKTLGERKMIIINSNSSVLEVFRLSGLLTVFTMQ